MRAIKHRLNDSDLTISPGDNLAGRFSLRRSAVKVWPDRAQRGISSRQVTGALDTLDSWVFRL